MSGPTSVGGAPRNGIGLREALKQEEHRLRTSRPLYLGFPRLERMLRISTGKYIVLAARPGMYKTTLAWVMACNLASQRKRVLWVGLEMGAGQMANLAIARRSGVTRDELEAHQQGVAGLLPTQKAAVEHAIRELPETLVFHQTGASLNEIRDTMSKVEYEAVFLDYVQLVQSGPAKEFERVSATSVALAHHAHSRNCLVVALAQMNREIEKVQGTGPQRMPSLADLRGSGQLEQDGDAVVFLHPPTFAADRDRTRMKVIVQKNRFGPGGFVDLLVSPQTAAIEEEPEEPIRMPAMTVYEGGREPGDD